jgi:hypothetical protein
MKAYSVLSLFPSFRSRLVAPKRRLVLEVREGKLYVNEQSHREEKFSPTGGAVFKGSNGFWLASLCSPGTGADMLIFERGIKPNQIIMVRGFVRIHDDSPIADLRNRSPKFLYDVSVAVREYNNSAPPSAWPGLIIG